MTHAVNAPLNPKKQNSRSLTYTKMFILFFFLMALIHKRLCFHVTKFCKHEKMFDQCLKTDSCQSVMVGSSWPKKMFGLKKCAKQNVVFWCLMFCLIVRTVFGPDPPELWDRNYVTLHQLLKVLFLWTLPRPTSLILFQIWESCHVPLCYFVSQI